MKEYISRIQAQKILGCNKEAMMLLLRSGEIETSRKENGGWLVSVNSLEEFKKRSKDCVSSVVELKRLVAAYKEENNELKRLLDENGIQYKNLTSKCAQKSFDITINDLCLPTRVLVSLNAHGINSVAQLCKMTDTELTSLRGFGKKTVSLIKSRLASFGIEPNDY